MAPPTPIKRKGYRQVHINKTVWDYKVGRQNVIIFSPSGKKCIASCWSVFGSNASDWDKYTFPITPGEVVKYIWAHLWIQENERQAIREPGVITSVKYGMNPDHKILSSLLVITFAGAAQGFGGGSFKTAEDMKDYLQKVCKTFGVQTPEELKGKLCYALRSLPSESHDIVGLEAADTGERFLHHKWYRERYSTKLNPLEGKKKILNMMIESAIRDINQAKQELATIDNEYVDWEQIGASVIP